MSKQWYHKPKLWDDETLRTDSVQVQVHAVSFLWQAVSRDWSHGLRWYCMSGNVLLLPTHLCLELCLTPSSCRLQLMTTWYGSNTTQYLLPEAFIELLTETENQES